jgi:putative phosphoserine phosphatase/1-acylglycerol-3-phosphate O-acyltransferase
LSFSACTPLQLYLDTLKDWPRDEVPEPDLHKRVKKAADEALASTKSTRPSSAGPSATTAINRSKSRTSPCSATIRRPVFSTRLTV